MSKQAANIIIRPNAELTIVIESVSGSKSPTATVITNTGEAIEEFPLIEGSNLINITPFLNKNYAIRVNNGKNVTVQKI